MSKTNKSFGTTTKRFDSKFELKEYFNLEPGPGTYCSQSTTTGGELSLMSSSTNLYSNTTHNTQGFGNGFVSKTSRFQEIPIDR
jgi:hypothetical protein